jgi:class 3 adenylate cyclase
MYGNRSWSLRIAAGAAATPPRLFVAHLRERLYHGASRDEHRSAAQTQGKLKEAREILGRIGMTAQAAREGGRKQVTVLFADVKGSMGWAHGSDKGRDHDN